MENDQIIFPKLPVKKTRKKTAPKIKNNLSSAPKPPLINNLKSSEVKSKNTSGKNKKRGKSSGLYSKIAISFIVLTVILIVVIFYLSYAKVLIILIPNQENLSDSLNLDVYDQSQAQNIVGASIVGIVKKIDVQQTKIYQTAGKEILGEEVTGEVTIINNYNKNQPLVASTRLLTPDNKLYRLKDTVNVPAGGQVKVQVYADSPKPDMVVGPTNFTIPGLWAGLQDKIYGQSQEPMKYSQRAKVKISQADIDNAVKDLKDSLLNAAKEQVNALYKDYSQVLFQIDNNSLSQDLDSKVGDEKNNFNLTMKTKVDVVAFNDDKIAEMAQQKLISILPDDKQLIDFNKKNSTYILNNYNIDQGIASVSVNFSGKMGIKDNAKIVDRKRLLGLTGEQLKQYLNSLPELAGYEIKFSPAFVNKVPELIDRISIEIKK